MEFSKRIFCTSIFKSFALSCYFLLEGPKDFKPNKGDGALDMRHRVYSLLDLNIWNWSMYFKENSPIDVYK